MSIVYNRIVHLNDQLHLKAFRLALSWLIDSFTARLNN
ncbi:hypothetical protein L579_1216 [Pantoea sp. AS-PWVM4]|nr:hypothetical protein L579_1216 [Pantoea sp. AS-PWVM4]